MVMHNGRNRLADRQKVGKRPTPKKLAGAEADAWSPLKGPKHSAASTSQSPFQPLPTPPAAIHQPAFGNPPKANDVAPCGPAFPTDIAVPLHFSSAIMQSPVITNTRMTTAITGTVITTDKATSQPSQGHQGRQAPARKSTTKRQPEQATTAPGRKAATRKAAGKPRAKAKPKPEKLPPLATPATVLPPAAPLPAALPMPVREEPLVAQVAPQPVLARETLADQTPAPPAQATTMADHRLVIAAQTHASPGLAPLPRHHALMAPPVGLWAAIDVWLSSAKKLLRASFMVKKPKPNSAVPPALPPLPGSGGSDMKTEPGLRDQPELAQLRAENHRLRSQLDAILAQQRGASAGFAVPMRPADERQPAES